jgi:hypothetical protein
MTSAQHQKNWWYAYQSLPSHPAYFHSPTMSTQPARCKYEILHSGTWWKDFHAAHRARQARQATTASNAGGHRLGHVEEAGSVYTFIPGRDEPFVTVPGVPSAMPRQSQNSGASSKRLRRKNAYTPLSGNDTILASRAHAEEVLLRSLAVGRT